MANNSVAATFKNLSECNDAERELAQKNGEKILRALWDCMDQLGAVPLCLVVVNFDDEVTAITPQGLAQILSREKWMEIWPGGKPSAQMAGKIDTQ